MKCPVCGQRYVPYGSPCPFRGQLFACMTHRGYGAYESELRSRGHTREVDQAVSEQARRVEEGRQKWAETNGYGSWDEAVERKWSDTE